MNPKLAIGMVMAVILLPLIGYFILRFGTVQQFNTLPYQYMAGPEGDSVVRELPDILLYRADSIPVTRDSLLNHLTYIDFFSFKDTLETTVLHGHIQRLYDNMKWDDYDGIRFVSINTGDDPAAVDAYRKRIKADPNRWMIVTGDEQELFRLGNDALGLGEFAQKSPGAQPFTSATVSLVDKAGKVRKYYQGYDLGQVRKIQEDMITLFRLEYTDDLGGGSVPAKRIDEP